MRPQRYEQVSGEDRDEARNTSPTTPRSPQSAQAVPSSPPPSFRSRTSSIASRRALLSEDPATTDAERTLRDTFDDGSDSDDDASNQGDDRRRLMRSNTAGFTQPTRRGDERLEPLRRPPVSQPPQPAEAPARPDFTGQPFSTFSHSNDGVFANLSAKPERGEKVEEQPPSYEAAAADAAPPYWENTILAPGNLTGTDEVYVDGLPVGSLFSFVWNGMISMSFQFVGFLLTYLLHTTHAAKNGSRAGLGITLVQYGFYMRAGAHRSAPPSEANDPALAPPADPNRHDINPNGSFDDAAAAAAAAAMQSSTSTASASSGTDWIAYALMIIGWFILIRAISDFIRARRHEQLVLQAPGRGLTIPVVAEDERPESVV